MGGAMHGLTCEIMGPPNVLENILLYMWVLILAILFYKITFLST